MRLQALAPVAPEYVHKFIPPLVKLMHRIAKDHAQHGAILAQAPRRAGAPAPPANQLPQPDYGTLVWAMIAALRLSARRVLTNADTKKAFLQTMVLLITSGAARHTDPTLLMEYLRIVRQWLLDPEPGGAHPLLHPPACHSCHWVSGCVP